jgi:hypothetical protein
VAVQEVSSRGSREKREAPRATSATSWVRIAGHGASKGAWEVHAPGAQAAGAAVLSRVPCGLDEGEEEAAEGVGRRPGRWGRGTRNRSPYGLGLDLAEGVQRSGCRRW